MFKMPFLLVQLERSSTQNALPSEGFNSCFMLLFRRNKSIKQELKQGPEVGLRVGNSHFGAAPNLGRSARKFNSYSPTGFPGLKSRFVYLSLFQKLYFINVVFTYALLLYIYRQQH